MNLSNEEFMCRLITYVSQHNISRSELARQINRPRETVQVWMKRGVRRESAREKVVMDYPHLFSEECSKEPLSESHAVGISEHLLNSKVKTALATLLIKDLSPVLVWFVFQASSEERDAFRKELGEIWEELQSLVRAMTSEMALKITDQEGRLDKWKQ